MTEQTTEIQSLLTEIKGGWAGVSTLPAEVKTLRGGNDKLVTDLKDVRRQLASRQTVMAHSRVGQVSEGCAGHVSSATFAYLADPAMGHDGLARSELSTNVFQVRHQFVIAPAQSFDLRGKSADTRPAAFDFGEETLNLGSLFGHISVSVPSDRLHADRSG